MSEMESIKRLFHDPNDSSSFSSKRNLERSLSSKGIAAKKSDIEKFVKSDIVYSLHLPARRRFPRNQYIVPHPQHTAQADVVDMQAFEASNNGYRYLLTIIDMFSKKAYVYPLKSKSGKEIASKFVQLFKTYRPTKIQTDRGGEFRNSEVKKLFEDHHVLLYFSLNSDIKCGVVERFNRTLKSRMFKYFSSRGTRKFIDVLPALIRGYNKSYHSTIKMSPDDVGNHNVSTVFSNIYGSNNSRAIIIDNINHRQAPLQINDAVRLRYELKPMEKSFYPNWTDEIFYIHSVIRGMTRLMYRVKNGAGDLISRRFYHEELQRVDPESKTRAIVLRRNRKKKLVLVKWLNHPRDKTSWVHEKDLQAIRQAH